jgi:hypothetical protein
MQIKRASLRMLACTLLLLAPALAGAGESKPGHGFVDEMARQGWSPTAPGVLQRQIGGRTETIGVGIEGFRAALEERQNLLGFYLNEAAVRPSKSLSETIGRLSDEVKQFRAYVAILEQKGITADFDALTNVGCSLALAYDATAAGQTTQQGVAGVASASVSSSCGLGNTYTSTYGYATLGGVTTSLSCSDAKYNGSSLSSSCSTLVTGGQSCSSQAYASVTVPPFGGVTAVTYSASQTNSSCPPPPFGVTISSGQFYFELSACQFVSWGATTTGGTPPGVIQSWTFDGAVASGGSTYSQYLCPPTSGSQNHTLRADGHDSSSPQQTAFDQKTVTVVKVALNPCATNPCSFACNPCGCDPCCNNFANEAPTEDLVKQRFCQLQ